MCMSKKNLLRLLERGRAMAAYGVQSNPHLSEKAHITLTALDDIAETVGAREAESGGLLLGPIGRDGISHFVFGEKGSVSRVTYSPSHEKLTALCEAAAEKGYELKGFCHSHPGLPTPSDGDEKYVRQFFDKNPSLQKFYLPILPEVPIRGTPGDGNGSKERNWSRIIEFYVVHRTSPYHYEKAEIVVTDESGFPELPTQPNVALSDVLRRLDIGMLTRLIGDAEITPTVVEADGFSIGCLSVQGEDVDVMVLMPTEFPVLSPTVIVTRAGEKSVRYRFRWSMESQARPERRLTRLIKAAMEDNSKDF